MKKLITALFCTVIVLGLTACANNSADMKAPALEVSLTSESGDVQSIAAVQLTTGWQVEGNGIQIDALHPAQLQPEDFLNATLNLNSQNGEIALTFDGDSPQFVAVLRWYAVYDTDGDIVSDGLDQIEYVGESKVTFEVVNDAQDYIYEVYAEWTEGNATGDSVYAFRLIS